jgi:RNA polymerase sigma-70 factor (ECF subfamily)
MVALGELPEMQRLAITLYDLEGYSHQEIGEILGIAVGTSRAHVHHARRALRKLLGPGVGTVDGHNESME